MGNINTNFDKKSWFEGLVIDVSKDTEEAINMLLDGMFTIPGIKIDHLKTCYNIMIKKNFGNDGKLNTSHYFIKHLNEVFGETECKDQIELIEQYIIHYEMIPYRVKKYKQKLMLADMYPYWRLSIVQRNECPPIELFLKDKVFKYDDTAWDSYYPPNYPCDSSSVVSFKLKDIQDDGLQVSSGITPENMPDPGYSINVPKLLLKKLG